MDPGVLKNRAMDVAYEILASVFGYYPTLDGYEMMMGAQSRNLVPDSAIFKLSNEFLWRGGEHDYVDKAKGAKDPLFVANQFKQHKGGILEETYWGWVPDTQFHADVESGDFGLKKLMTSMMDEGKKGATHTATSLYTEVLESDIRNSDWYDTILIPLDEGRQMGSRYAEYQEIIKENRRNFGQGHDALEGLNLYHVVMKFPTKTDEGGLGDTWKGFIAVMPVEVLEVDDEGDVFEHPSYSNMALLVLKEYSDPKSSGAYGYISGQIIPSFGENAYKTWKSLMPEARYQSINKQIVLETK